MSKGAKKIKDPRIPGFEGSSEMLKNYGSSTESVGKKQFTPLRHKWTG